jgi:hypothetical protein
VPHPTAKERRTKDLGIQRKLERESTAALDIVNRLLVKIERRKALTVAGIVAKAKVAIEAGDNKDFVAGLGVSMARDLVALKAGVCSGRRAKVSERG